MVAVAPRSQRRDRVCAARRWAEGGQSRCSGDTTGCPAPPAGLCMVVALVCGCSRVVPCSWVNPKGGWLGFACAGGEAFLWPGERTGPVLMATAGGEPRWRACWPPGCELRSGGALGARPPRPAPPFACRRAIPPLALIPPCFAPRKHPPPNRGIPCPPVTPLGGKGVARGWQVGGKGGARACQALDGGVSCRFIFSHF
jgi:hypothetical protein